jgi:hypothetical protein
VGYASAIAAAIRYDGSDDVGTRDVQETLRRDGVGGVLIKHCQLADGSPLAELAAAAYARQDFLIAKGLGGKQA